jgi:diadenosine tetraphosphate (Ap4A) HIT family hydrolase
MASDPNCIFCKIICGSIPSYKIAETEHAYAFLDINPLSRGHCLVIPKMHAVQVHEVSEEGMRDVGVLISKVAKGIGAENYNVLQNNGASAGQVVMHAHFHIIPRSAGDGLTFNWKSQPTPAKDDMIKLLGEIQSRMAKV